MRINKRVFIPVLGLLAIVFMVSILSLNSFSMKTSSMQNSVADMAVGSPAERDFIEEEKAELGFTSNSVAHSKVITNIYVSLETMEFNSSVENLGKIINKNNGYIENSNISHNNYYNNKILKYANYTIRVPKENVENFTKEMDSIGNIVSQNTSKQDIAKQYYDTESRLNVLKIKEQRILALLEKAEKMEDIITIENQLSEIIYQKESLTKNILDMDDKVSYSTVNINVSEVEKLTTGVTPETSFGTKIASAFRDSLYFFKISIEKFVVTFIYILPYGLIVGIIGVFVYRFVKKNRDDKDI